MTKGLLKPIGEKIVVSRVEAEAETKGGIVLPDSAKEKPQRGVVKAVGSGKMMEGGTRSNMQVEVGDQIIFTTYAGSEVKINDDEYVIMNESDVLAILE